MLFAVNVGEVATPLALIAMLVVITPPAKVPLAPLAGAVNVTTPPETGSPNALLTVATNAEANAVVIVALIEGRIDSCPIRMRSGRRAVRAARHRERVARLARDDHLLVINADGEIDISRNALGVSHVNRRHQVIDSPIQRRCIGRGIDRRTAG